MSAGVRHLTVLGEFKPFGLVAEALDGKPADNVTDKYDYFLFDPEITKQRDEADDHDASSASTDRNDHELFIRGNRIIWTIGSRLYKRFTIPSSVIMVYLSLYTTIVSMADEVTSSGTSILGDSLFLSSFKLALAYNEALLNGRLTTSRGGIVQSTFLGSLRKCIEELWSHSPALKDDLHNYLKSGRWPGEVRKPSTFLSWYLQWYGVPAPSVIKIAVSKIKPIRTSSVPLLRLLLPRTHINAICEIDKYWFSSTVDGRVRG